MVTPSEQLRQEVQDAVIQACSFEYDELLFTAIDDVYALIEREKRNAVMDYMDELTKQEGRFSFSKAQLDALDEMFPDKP